MHHALEPGQRQGKTSVPRGVKSLSDGLQAHGAGRAVDGRLSGGSVSFPDESQGAVQGQTPGMRDQTPGKGFFPAIGIIQRELPEKEGLQAGADVDEIRRRKGSDPGHGQGLLSRCQGKAHLGIALS